MTVRIYIMTCFNFVGIPQLMESEDVLRYADKRSMFLYISSVYQHFSTVHTTVGRFRRDKLFKIRCEITEYSFSKFWW